MTKKTEDMPEGTPAQEPEFTEAVAQADETAARWRALIFERWHSERHG